MSVLSGQEHLWGLMKGNIAVRVNPRYLPVESTWGGGTLGGTPLWKYIQI